MWRFLALFILEEWLVGRGGSAGFNMLHCVCVCARLFHVKPTLLSWPWQIGPSPLAQDTWMSPHTFVAISLVCKLNEKHLLGEKKLLCWHCLDSSGYILCEWYMFVVKYLPLARRPSVKYVFSWCLCRPLQFLNIVNKSARTLVVFVYPSIIRPLAARNGTAMVTRESTLTQATQIRHVTVQNPVWISFSVLDA